MSKTETLEHATEALKRARVALEEHDGQSEKLLAERRRKHGELEAALLDANHAVDAARRREDEKAKAGPAAARVRGMDPSELDAYTLRTDDTIIGTCDAQAPELVVARDIFEREDRRRVQLLRAARRQTWAAHCHKTKALREARDDKWAGNFVGRFLRGMSDEPPKDTIVDEPEYTAPTWADIAAGRVKVDMQELRYTERAMNLETILPNYELPAGGLTRCAI